LAVYKMTGSGNDFVMVDGRFSTPGQWSAADIRRVCARGTGIGADGLVFVAPGSSSSTLRMTYYNSDGSPAAMCGNAALCSTRLAAFLGLADPAAIRLETDAGLYESRCEGGPDRAELHLPTVARPTAPAILLQPGEERAAVAIVGVPHLVVVVEDLDRIDILSRGRALRSEPALGPQGANVNFVVARDPGESTWAMRTYERGIEAETLACGTGAVAAACCLHAWGIASLPLTLMSRSGLPLGVRASSGSAGSYEDVWLEGEARIVFRGLITS
jgi:diaminopimelate epimerase